MIVCSEEKDDRRRWDVLGWLAIKQIGHLSSFRRINSDVLIQKFQ